MRKWRIWKKIINFFESKRLKLIALFEYYFYPTEPKSKQEILFTPFSENEWEVVSSFPPVVLKNDRPFWNYYLRDNLFGYQFVFTVLTFSVTQKDAVMAEIPKFLKELYPDNENLKTEFYFDEGQFYSKFDLYLAKFFIEYGAFDYDLDGHKWFAARQEANILFTLERARIAKGNVFRDLKKRVRYKKTRNIYYYFRRRFLYKSQEDARFELEEREPPLFIYQKEPYYHTEIYNQDHSKFIFGIPKSKTKYFQVFIYDFRFASVKHKCDNFLSFRKKWNARSQSKNLALVDLVVIRSISKDLPDCQATNFLRSDDNIVNLAYERAKKRRRLPSVILKSLVSYLVYFGGVSVFLILLQKLGCVNFV